MWQAVIFGFLAGAFLANGLPHFVAGSTGGTQWTPFGSSSTVNVLGGWANFVVGTALLSWAHPADHWTAAATAIGVGVLVSGLYHARTWNRYRTRVPESIRSDTGAGGL